MGLKPLALDHRIGQLGEPVAELSAGDDRLEALGIARPFPMLTGQRGDLDRVVGDEDRPPQLGLAGLLVDLEDEFSGAVVILHLDAEPLAQGPKLVHRRFETDLHTGVLRDEFFHRGAAPRGGKIDLATVVFDGRGAQDLLGDTGDEVLGEFHHVGVVGVGPVELQHRELGIVPSRHALVAEHAADLEHLLHTADDQPLQVELGRDAQVEVLPECVVVGDERTGERSAGDRVQHRCLDLDEALTAQDRSHRRDDLTALRKRIARLVGDPHVDIALPIARVGVGDAVPLVGKRPLGRGEHIPGVDSDAEFAAAGHHHHTGDGDPVTDREAGEVLEVGGGLRHGEQLDTASRVLE